MNIFKKVYNRTYQFVIRAAQRFLPYKEPIVFSNIHDVVKILKEEEIKKPIVISDQGLYQAMLPQIIYDDLEKVKIDFAYYNDVTPNPTTKNIEDLVDIYKTCSCDAIIALGGGSVMDAAKALGAVISNPKRPINKMKGILKVRKKTPLIMAVPTTIGTGSEVTPVSVIIDSNTSHKYAITDFVLTPSYAILDSRLLLKLPKSIIAQSGMDALTHAIESYINKGCPKSAKQDAKDACKLIFENLLDAYLNKNESSLHNMQQAAYLAGRSFSLGFVGTIHAMAHALGGKYNAPHGLVNAILLPSVLMRYGLKVALKLKEIAIYCNLVDKKANPIYASMILINKIIEMNEMMNIPKTFEIKKEDINHLATLAYHECHPLYPVPVMFTKEEIASIYMEIGKIC